MGKASLRDADLKRVSNIEIYFIYYKLNTECLRRLFTTSRKFLLPDDFEVQLRKVLNFGTNL
jgi:hypothetical protein